MPNPEVTCILFQKCDVLIMKRGMCMKNYITEKNSLL